MHCDFKEKHVDFKCAYETYRTVVREMKISFAKLGEERCEVCGEFRLNERLHDHDVNREELHDTVDMKPGCKQLEDYTCQLCKTWMHHIRSAKISRVLPD